MRHISGGLSSDESGDGPWFLWFVLGLVFGMITALLGALRARRPANLAAESACPTRSADAETEP